MALLALSSTEHFPHLRRRRSSRIASRNEAIAWSIRPQLIQKYPSSLINVKVIDDEILFTDDFPFKAAYALPKTEREHLTVLLRRLLSAMEEEAGRHVGPKGALRPNEQSR